MNLSSIREGELKEVFDELEDAFAQLNIDFYLIGALARDIWYARGDKQFRTTKDVDFAIMISNKDDYEAVRNYLIDNKGYREVKTNSFVLLTPADIQVDILPFGEIEINDEVKFEGAGLTSIKVNGFSEVYLTGTEIVKLATGHTFKVATLPAIILLKFIAYDDRPEVRSKDARDIINIMLHFFDLQADLIYDSHADLFGGEEMELEDIAAIVIGREIRKIADSNENLFKRMDTIMDGLLLAKEDSAFVRNMVSESGRTVEEILYLLTWLQIGLNQ
ncbi:nucleotidyl transferase AbiEii/AbiGii toxin family protein [Mucilaginibacter sp. PAMB04274]|uniref:nucleotidyl transferase AbiEii/AbiGii toxin family protein n=1 Tax=Mucilaginibacter sp. PAMB04274 TaxID=3138568 RepID=UPI0031F6361C